MSAQQLSEETDAAIAASNPSRVNWTMALLDLMSTYIRACIVARKDAETTVFVSRRVWRLARDSGLFATLEARFPGVKIEPRGSGRGIRGLHPRFAIYDEAAQMEPPPDTSWVEMVDIKDFDKDQT